MGGGGLMVKMLDFETHHTQSQIILAPIQVIGWKCWEGHLAKIVPVHQKSQRPSFLAACDE